MPAISRLVATVALASLVATPVAAHPHGSSYRAVGPVAPVSGQGAGERAWLAGDHHVHSRFSAAYPMNPAAPSAPPRPVLGGDGRYAIPRNAAMARRYGLAWMVSTDHGGPDHSKLNYEEAYPELLRSRAEVPEVIQFYGMEFDTPAGDHSSLIVPRTDAERQTLREIESEFAKYDAFPPEPSRDTEPKMLDALRHMRALPDPPLVIANHPSRSAEGVGSYGQHAPAELRAWNDLAPKVAIGMEGAPGHQAAALATDWTIKAAGARGGYGRSPTMGGFDQMTARLGGFWDSMLGEGRRWWVTSTSDSHRHFTEGGSDFWPGEYSKTYVHARRDAADIVDGIRNGRVFVTTGDLISELDLTVTAGGRSAQTGSVLGLAQGRDVRVTLRLRDPAAVNAARRKPAVERVDLIVGDVVGRGSNPHSDANPTARVERRFTAADWTRKGEILTMSHIVREVTGDMYVRVRGTNTDQLEPVPDPPGEDPWTDLWFYSNPVFLTVP